MTSILDKLGIPADITKQIEEAKAKELETEDSGSKFPEFEIKAGETRTISILPGLGGWVNYAISQGVDLTSADARAWIEDRATAQTRALDFNDVIPTWAMIPAKYPNAARVSGLFVPKLGRVSYAGYTAAVLAKLPADHPRRLALTIRGKFGLSKVKHAMLAYCIEHPVGKKGLDDQALEQLIRQGGFVKLLAMNMPTYDNLKDAKAAAIQMGKPELPTVHLVTTLQDPKFIKLGFQINMTTPAWHQPEMLRLVLQEIEKLGPVETKSPYRDVSDEELEDAVKQALESDSPAT